MVLVRPQGISLSRGLAMADQRGLMFSKFNFLLVYPFCFSPGWTGPPRPPRNPGTSVLYLTPS